MLEKTKEKVVVVMVYGKNINLSNSNLAGKNWKPQHKFCLNFTFGCILTIFGQG